MERAELLDFGDTHLDNMAAVQVESRLRLIAPSNCPFFLYSCIRHPFPPPFTAAHNRCKIASAGLDSQENSAGLEFDHFLPIYFHISVSLSVMSGICTPLSPFKAPPLIFPFPTNCRSRSRVKCRVRPRPPFPSPLFLRV